MIFFFKIAYLKYANAWLVARKFWAVSQDVQNDHPLRSRKGLLLPVLTYFTFKCAPIKLHFSVSSKQ